MSGTYKLIKLVVERQPHGAMTMDNEGHRAEEPIEPDKSKRQPENTSDENTASMNPLRTESIEEVKTASDLRYEDIDLRRTAEFKPGLVSTAVIGLALLVATVVPVVLPPSGEASFPAFTYLWGLLAIVTVITGLGYVYWVEKIEDERSVSGVQ